MNQIQINQTLEQIEHSFQNYGVDSLSCQVDCQDLRVQIREYCEDKGLGSISTESLNHPPEASNKEIQAFLREVESE